MNNKSCWDCVHCEVCADINGFSQHISDVSKCKNFMDKSDFEIVRHGQQAEIERLKEEREMLLKECKRCGRRKDKRTRKLKNQLKTARKKAIKEFAERLKERAVWDGKGDTKIVYEYDIDSLVRKMNGGQKLND